MSSKPPFLLALALCLSGCGYYGADGGGARAVPVHKMQKLKMYEIAGSSRPWTLDAKSAELKDGEDTVRMEEPLAVYAHGASTSTVKSRQGRFNMEDSTAVFSKNAIAFTDGGRIKLETEELKYSPKSDRAWSDVKVDITRVKDGSTTTVSAQKGFYNLARKDGALSGNVVAHELRDNVTLETEQLNYSEKNALMWSDKPVKMTEIRENSPTVVTASSGSYDLNGRTAVFSGDVVALEQKDNVELYTDRLVYNHQTALLSSESPVRMKTVRDNSVSTVTARKGSYDAAGRSAVFTGNVVARSEKDKTMLETEKLFYSAKRALIYTDEAVRLTGDSTVVRGRGFEAKPDLSEISVMNQETELPKK
ncbi:MAG: LPS export ABC transporter periplasmic protein LptC [Elusimicrobiales bacterium]